MERRENLEILEQLNQEERKFTYLQKSDTCVVDLEAIKKKRKIKMTICSLTFFILKQVKASITVKEKVGKRPHSTLSSYKRLDAVF